MDLEERFDQRNRDIREAQNPLKEELKQIRREEKNEQMRILREIKATVDSQGIYIIRAAKNIEDILKELWGDGKDKKGLVKRVDDHDHIVWMGAGGVTLISVTLAILKVFGG